MNSTVSVNENNAEEVLKEYWDKVQNDVEFDLDDYPIKQKIREVLNAKQLTYKYIMFTAILAKAVNKNIHYQAMQSSSELDGAYNARSLAHHVVVPWEKSNGERLGGSNEPYLNKPARHPKFSSDEVPARNTDARDRLSNLLKRMEEKVNNGDIEPKKILGYTLTEIQDLEPNIVDFEGTVSEAPYVEIDRIVEEFIEDSGSGERLPAVVAGAMKVWYEHSNPGDGWKVKAENANVPDEFSDEAGDVEVFNEDELVRAIEVKDKPTEPSDIQHSDKKARKFSLTEYLYVVGDGYANGKKQKVLDELDEVQTEVILVFPPDIMSLLKFVTDRERENFLKYVGDYLNKMRADKSNKEKWKELISQLE